MEFGGRRFVGAVDLLQELAVVHVGDVGDEVRALVEAVEDDHHGHGFGQLGQMTLEPMQRVVIESVEGFIEHEELGTAGERPDEHDLSGLSCRQLAERPIQQRLEPQCRDQLLGQLLVEAAVGDDLGDRRPFGDDVEDVGVVLAQLGCDQLRLPLVGHERHVLRNPGQRPRKVIALPREDSGKRRLPRPIGPSNQPLLPGRDRPAHIEKPKPPIKVDRQVLEDDHWPPLAASSEPLGEELG